MTKRSRMERAKRDEESERVRQIEAAWLGSMPPDMASAFRRDVEAARERGPRPPAPDMAPGTPPRPPRPGHEPKPPKAGDRPRRRAY